MADEIKPVDESKPIAVSASIEAQKEYTDDKGEKISVSESELNPEALKSADVHRIEIISGLKELAAKELCQNCRFWNPIQVRLNKKGESFPINGECRVNAPEMTCRTIISGSSDHSSSYWTSQEAGVFPLIGPFQWCGKYEPIKIQPIPIPDPVITP